MPRFDGQVVTKVESETADISMADFETDAHVRAAVAPTVEEIRSKPLVPHAEMAAQLLTKDHSVKYLACR